MQHHEPGGLAHTSALIVWIIQWRLPHSSRFSTSGHHGTPNSKAFRDATLHRWVKENGVRSAKPLILSSEVPTLRESRRVGQPSFVATQKEKYDNVWASPPPTSNNRSWCNH